MPLSGDTIFQARLQFRCGLLLAVSGNEKFFLVLFARPSHESHEAEGRVYRDLVLHLGGAYDVLSVQEWESDGLWTTGACGDSRQRAVTLGAADGKHSQFIFFVFEMSSSWLSDVCHQLPSSGSLALMVRALMDRCLSSASVLVSRRDHVGLKHNPALVSISVNDTALVNMKRIEWCKCVQFRFSVESSSSVTRLQ